MVGIITKKKLGQALTPEEIAYFVHGAANRSIADYQLAALLMAIRLNGMTPEETKELTLSLIHISEGGCYGKHSCAPRMSLQGKGRAFFAARGTF